MEVESPNYYRKLRSLAFTLKQSADKTADFTNLGAKHPGSGSRVTACTGLGQSSSPELQSGKFLWHLYTLKKIAREF